jgi:hypothetical protein
MPYQEISREGPNITEIGIARLDARANVGGHDVEEVPNEAVTILGRCAFGMKLNAVNRQVPMPDALDCPVA